MVLWWMTTALSGIVQDLDDWYCLKDFSTKLRQSQHISDTMVFCEAMEAVRSLSPCKLQLNILINYGYFKISFGKRKKKCSKLFYQFWCLTLGPTIYFQLLNIYDSLFPQIQEEKCGNQLGRTS